MRERVTDHFRLLVDLLRHEVLIVTLVNELRRCRGLENRTLDLTILFVANLHALAREHRPVTVLEVADGVGERRKRDRVGAEIHFAIAVTDRERRALSRSDQEIVLAGKEKRERKSPAQLLERGRNGFFRRLAAFHFLRDEMCHRLGVGLAGKFAAAFGQLLTQIAIILDDAVMHDGNQIGCVRMGIILGRPPVRCPARMTDADRATERFTIETIFERTELSFRTPAAEHAFLKRGDTGRVVAAIFEALKRVDQLARNRSVSENSDDAAHPPGWPLCPLAYGLAVAAKPEEIKTHFAV
jgi:hypothetical protein